MRILALAYYYPPSAESGTHRSLDFLNRLVASGDDVTVLTAKEEDFSIGTPVDSELLSKVDRRIRIIRASVARPLYWLLKSRQFILGRGTSLPAVVPTRPGKPSAGGLIGRRLQAFKDAITDSLTFPDEHVGWIPDALRQGSQAIRLYSPHCIYSSGGPWSSHIAAALLKKRHGLPLVLDFRDPWTSNPYQCVGRGRLKHVLERKLEAFCLGAADHIVVNTEPLRRDFMDRYPQQRASRFTTITNGFESLVTDESAAPSQRFTLVHAGYIYPPRNPAPFLRAVLQLIRQDGIKASELRVQFVGSCPDQGDVVALLATQELKSVVEVTARVSHSRALQFQVNADALLLFQKGFPLQVPRKLFEYMSMQKPILAIAERGSATAAILQEAGIGVLAEEDVESISRALTTLYADWKHGVGRRFDRDRTLKFRNDSLAIQLRAVLQAVSESQPARAIGLSDA